MKINIAKCMSDPFNQQSVRIRASEVSVTSYAWLLMLSCALLPPNSGLHVFRMQPTIPLIVDREVLHVDDTTL